MDAGYLAIAGYAVLCAVIAWISHSKWQHGLAEYQRGHEDGYTQGKKATRKS